MSLEVDIYEPSHVGLDDRYLPLCLILQGAGVDKREYAALATSLANHGHGVIVPNCVPTGRNYICPDGESAATVFRLPALKRAASLQDSLVRGVVLFGHSAGGIAAFEALSGHLSGTRKLPSRILGIVVYGSGAPDGLPHSTMPPVLLISGDQDSVVPSRVTRAGYDRLVGSDRAHIILRGMNHYSLTDTGRPASAPPESHPEAIPTQDEIVLIAQLVHQFTVAVQAEATDWASRVVEGSGGRVAEIRHEERRASGGRVVSHP